jgi:hypothetical protein
VQVGKSAVRAWAIHWVSLVSLAWAGARRTRP